MSNEKIFYIKYDEINNIESMKKPIGVIIDIDVDDLDNLKKIYSNIINEHKIIIQKVIFKMDINEELSKHLFINDNVYFYIKNEEENRDLIDKMDAQLKKQIIGKKVCTCGIDILLYRSIGIHNIIVSSPLINDKKELEMLEKIGYNLFVIPNYSNAILKEVLDPSWIRPEGIRYYPNIKNWVIVSNKLVNINTALRSYIREQWIGPLASIIVNFDNPFNVFRDSENLLAGTFDIRRSMCEGNCLNCNKCNKEFMVIKKLIEKEE